MTPLEKASARLDRDEYVATAIAQGWRLVDIAAALGVDLSAVRNVVRRCGIKYVYKRERDPEMTAKRNARIVAAVTAGESHKSVAERLGLDPTRIGQIVRSHSASSDQPQPVEVPRWVPRHWHDEYLDHADLYGEEAAASHCRRLKAASAARCA